MVQKIVMYDKEKEIERLKAQLAEQDEICTKLKGDLRVAERETSNLEYINNNLKELKDDYYSKLQEIRLRCGSLESENQELKMYIDTLKTEIEELKNLENRVICEKYNDCNDQTCSHKIPHVYNYYCDNGTCYHHKCNCIPYKEEM